MNEIKFEKKREILHSFDLGYYPAYICTVFSLQDYRYNNNNIDTKAYNRLREYAYSRARS